MPADTPLMVTVFHACKTAEHFGPNGCVSGNASVTEKKPASGDWNLLFELHVPTSELVAKKKGEFEIPWEVAEGWPMQASSL